MSVEKTLTERMVKKAIDDITHVVYHWDEITTIFHDSQERCDLLNQAAGAFFHDCYHAMVTSVILGVSRFLDKEKVGPHETFVLSALEKQVENDSSIDWKGKEASGAEVVTKLASIRKQLEAKAEPLRKYRHNWLAHTNKGVAIGDDPIPEVVLANVKDSVHLLFDWKTCLEHAYTGRPSVRRFHVHGNSEAVLWLIRLNAALNSMQKADLWNYHKIYTEIEKHFPDA